MNNKFVSFLYKTKIGRFFLKILILPPISKIVSIFLNSKLSCFLIKIFIKKYNINMQEYYNKKYTCFNDFFTRKINFEFRKFNLEKHQLISPCDGLLSIYSINNHSIFNIKNSKYTISSLLQNENLAKKYINGLCLIFRLCVNNYHRYHYIDNGIIEDSKYIKGCLHTVQPIALDNYKIYSLNSREYTILNTEHFKNICQIEVGALLVGKILNNHKNGYKFKKLEEKGMFLYGGSTIILLLENNTVRLKPSFINYINSGKEIPVFVGQPLTN